MSDVHPQVDLTNCDREPIHILGAIQPIGFLIALSSDWMIARVSNNAGAFIGAGDSEALLGRPLAGLLPAGTIHALRNRVAMLRGPDAVERLFGCPIRQDGDPFDIAVHVSGGQIVIEAEPGSGDTGDATGTVRSMIARLDQVVAHVER